MVAVDLGARRDEHRPLEARAVLEHVLGALDVRKQRSAGLLDDQAYAYGSGQVVHDVAPVHELADDGLREHGVDHEVEALAVAEVEDVRLLAGREVVESEDFHSFVEEELGQVRADEARSAGDQGAHAAKTNRLLRPKWPARAALGPVSHPARKAFVKPCRLTQMGRR